MSKNPPKRPGGQPGQAQPQQPNWLILAVWTLCAFMLFQTCSRQPAAQQKPQTDLRQTLVSQNAALQEVTARQTYQEYTRSLDEEQSALKGQLDKKAIDQSKYDSGLASINSRRAEAAVLYADALLRGGEKTGRLDRFQDAYQTLHTIESSQGTTANWDANAVQLPANATRAATSITPKALYDKVSTEFAEANKTHPVWGFIPGYQLMDFLVHVTGGAPGFSYWFAAFLLAFLVRSLAFPLTQKQLMFSRQMAQLTPLVKEVQEKYKNDDALKQRKTMELYGEYGINPAAGCFPLLIQLPFFFAIYQCMLQYRFDFQKGTFLWINSSVSAATHGFIAPNLGQPDRILIVIYGISMLVSTLMMPVSDPTNAKQQRIMGVIFALLVPVLMLTNAYPLPCAFVLYWTFTNVLSTAQTLYAYKLPAPPLIKVSTKVGGVVPQAPRKQSWWERMQEMAAAQLEERQRAVEQAKGDQPGGDPAKGSGGTEAKPKAQEFKPKFETEGQTNGSNGKSSSNGQGKSGPKTKPKRRT
jgi:YidC/Oxa1 family membrane protein insertase